MGNSVSRRAAAGLRQKQIRAKAGKLAESPDMPRFVADVMLGRLAKWLRIAGFDVHYSNRITDDELIALSHREDRVILSRDTRLLIRRTVRRFLYLESEKIHDQVRQVFRFTKTHSLPEILTRCLTCNETLTEIARDKVRDRVPPFVFETQPRFKACRCCGRIFWAGTHRQAVLRTLEGLLDKD